MKKYQDLELVVIARKIYSLYKKSNYIEIDKKIPGVKLIFGIFPRVPSYFQGSQKLKPILSSLGKYRNTV